MILRIVFIVIIVAMGGQINAQVINNFQSLYAANKFQQLIDYSESLLEKDKSNFEAWYYKGLAEQSLYRYKYSAISFKKALEYASDSSNVLYSLANVLTKGGDRDGAINIYKNILETDSTYIAAKAKLAGLYKGRKDYIKASDIYTQLIKQDSANGYFYSQLAYCCSKLGLKNAASDYYFTAFKLNIQDFYSVKGFLSELVKQKYYEDAQAYIDTFLFIFPNNLYLFKQQAFLAAIGGNYRDAVEGFQKVVELGDTSMFTCKYYGQSLYNNGNYADAVYWLSKYLENHPSDAKNLFIIGVACQKDYQYENSLDHFAALEAILFDKQTLARIYVERANTYVAFGEYQGFRDSTGVKKKASCKLALESLLAAEAMYPDNYTIYKYLGGFYDDKMKNAQIALYYYQIYYNKLDTKTINEKQLIWIQDKLGKLKEEVHFIGE